MEIDRDLLQKISLLDDDSLRTAIQNVAMGMGIDPQMTSMYLNDMGKIKETVSGLTGEDLARVQGALGEENTRNLVSRIREEIEGK